MCKRTVVQVALDNASGSYDKLYTYLVPDMLLSLATCGCRVCVPFGRANKKRIGIVFSIYEAEDISGFKSIISVVDKQPILSDEMLKLCSWMHNNLICTYFDAVNTILPTGLRFQMQDRYVINTEFVGQSLLTDAEVDVYNLIKNTGEVTTEKIKNYTNDYSKVLLSLTDKGAILRTTVAKRNQGDLLRRYVKLNDSTSVSAIKLTNRQQEIIDTVQIAGEVSVKELQYFTGVSLSVINTLISKGVLEDFQKQEFRIPKRSGYVLADNSEIVLNDEQNTAYLGLKEKMFSETGETALLYGVTGSGKTQVFIRLTDEAIKNNLGVIIMVPEIALTPQMIGLFSARYGDNIAVFHSAMSMGQRMDEYRRIECGQAKIAIGTRSAVFAPFDKLGLIVMDEEQEHTYKSEKTPRYHARDIAKLRIMYHKALLCLSSATPSLQSYSKAIAGAYSLYKLPHRYNNVSLPQVRVVNMREELEAGNKSSISRELVNLLSEQLKTGKQSIILLNRRGHNTYISCPECGFVATCDNCSISMTYHSANKRLMCHYCGHSVPVYKKCPECGCEYLSFSGVGTQSIQEELSKIFPEARILRLDADSTMTRNSYANNLGDFAEGKYDIMIGTQMVAKGLDFPNVSLVGVIGADKALNSDDYRSFERTFDLLTQVIGRAGRAKGHGIAVIQTNDNDNRIIDLARQQDYEAFYSEEILSRKVNIFPPYCDLCLIVLQSDSESVCKKEAFSLFHSIKELIESDYTDQHLVILGPNQASVFRIGGKYRYRMLIKCRYSARFRDMIKTACKDYDKKKVSISVDINPENVI